MIYVFNLDNKVPVKDHYYFVDWNNKRAYWTVPETKLNSQDWYDLHVGMIQNYEFFKEKQPILVIK